VALKQNWAHFYLFVAHRPNNIITSAVAADLAAHPSVRGNNKSLGTVTGLINGTGSITASIGLLAVGPLQSTYGWGSVWVYLIGCTATGTLLMSSKIYAELFPPSSASNGIVV
jgi:MFS transporter, OPA family, solute carrier family 37 (glycerol-3-phosphate transporter), member 1/2